LGADRSRAQLPDTIGYRLGLSATPDRWFDDVGTEVLREYFGETAFSYPLEDAIGVVLTPYRYFPQLVELTGDELSEYQELSHKIARLMNSDYTDAQEALEMLLIKRARLLNTAQGKLAALSAILRSLKRVDHALFYCAPEQIDDVCRLLGWEHELSIHPFTAEEPNDERQQLLLDFDLIAIPPQNWAGGSSFAAEQSIIRHELQRFREFASSAKNKHQAIDVIMQIARRYDIPEF